MARAAKKSSKKLPGVHRSTGRRLTVEQQQEYRSRAQFDERFSEFGWIVNSRDRDHGEDLSIDIYDDGRSTGLAFMVQLKSTDDVGRYVPKKDDKKLVYRLEVDDLQHWEIAAHLVVVFIWDVSQRNGAWLPVPEIIKQLDESSAAWRKQKRVSVSFSRSNAADDASLQRLRRSVADHNMPIVSRGKNIKIDVSFEFANDAEGKAAAKSLQGLLDFGEPAQIDGQYISNWEMPTWWERLYGKVAPDRIEMRPVSDTNDIWFRMEVDEPNGIYATDVCLRRERGGRAGFVLKTISSEEPIYIKLSCSIDESLMKINMDFRVSRTVDSVFGTRRATELLVALCRGTCIRLVHRETGAVLVDRPVPPEFAEDDIAQLLQWKELVDKLCFVQSKVYKIGTIKIPKRGIKRSEAIECEKFFEIAKHGMLRRKVGFNAEIDLAEHGQMWRDIVARVREGHPISIGTDISDAGAIKVLNLEVPLGPVTIRHDATAIVSQVEAALAAGQTVVRVSMKNVDVVEQYSSWSTATEVSLDASERTPN